MLEIRPNCEYCDRDLPADSEQAYICTYECTFCHDCVENILNNVCPNCGGGFAPRPIRPRLEHRQGLSLSHQPASIVAVNTRYSLEQITAFSDALKNIKPENR